jgi:hypothetical protein
MVSSPAVLERDSREARKKGDLVRRGRGGYAIGVRGRGRGRGRRRGRRRGRGRRKGRGRGRSRGRGRGRGSSRGRGRLGFGCKRREGDHSSRVTSRIWRSSSSAMP